MVNLNLPVQIQKAYNVSKLSVYLGGENKLDKHLLESLSFSWMGSAAMFCRHTHWPFYKQCCVIIAGLQRLCISSHIICQRCVPSARKWSLTYQLCCSLLEIESFRLEKVFKVTESNHK